MDRIPIIALTPGEPAGIGPDLAVGVAQAPPGNGRVVILGDPELLQQRSRQLGIRLDLPQWSPDSTAAVSLLPVTCNVPVRAGRLDPDNSAYVLNTLEHALAGCLEGEFDALVTGPVHKGIINQAGIPFTGHTEFLANRCGVKRVVMMLVSDSLRVALATTHIPLKRVGEVLTQELLEDVIRILHHQLRHRFAIIRPRILVCGLNPHAGESGCLGREEIDTIKPVLDRLEGEGMQLHGPMSADTAFTPASLAMADVVLTMYHDQGLPVLKHAAFGKAVNVTLGLPMVRTSVDHGTALELAGSGKIDHGSLLTAIRMAQRLLQA